MGNIYGAGRWEREYGVDPLEAWTQGLGHCTMADIARGIEIAGRIDRGRLPDLGTVRSWCRHFNPGTFAGNAVPKAQPLPALENMASRSKAGRAWLAFWRYDGIRPMGDATTDDLDRDLEGWNIEDMRKQVDA